MEEQERIDLYRQNKEAQRAFIRRVYDEERTKLKEDANRRIQKILDQMNKTGSSKSKPWGAFSKPKSSLNAENLAREQSSSPKAQAKSEEPARWKPFSSMKSESSGKGAAFSFRSSMKDEGRRRPFSFQSSTKAEETRNEGTSSSQPHKEEEETPGKRPLSQSSSHASRLSHHSFRSSKSSEVFGEEGREESARHSGDKARPKSPKSACMSRPSTVYCLH